jgi:hypothetical protein
MSSWAEATVTVVRSYGVSVDTFSAIVAAISTYIAEQLQVGKVRWASFSHPSVPLQLHAWLWAAVRSCSRIGDLFRRHLWISNLSGDRTAVESPCEAARSPKPLGPVGIPWYADSVWLCAASPGKINTILIATRCKQRRDHVQSVIKGITAAMTRQ